MTPQAKLLYKTVEQIGLKRAQVRRILPSWWDPQLEDQADGVAELAMHLSRRLSLDLEALMRSEIKPKGAVASLAFKHRADVDPAALSAATFIASSLVQAVLHAMPSPYIPLPSNPDEVRAMAAAAHSGTMGFDALLTLCWAHGIPVLALPHLPVGIRKMDGAALQVGDRPAIVVARKKSSRAWLSFILAHEVGHICSGHLRPGSSIVDISLQETATYQTDGASDGQEREADDFALQVLGGTEAMNAMRNWPLDADPVELAVLAREAAKVLLVEPGHLILRHAFESRRWPQAIAALRFLSEDFSPEKSLSDHLMRNIELDAVGADLQDLLVQVTGIEEAGSR